MEVTFTVRKNHSYDYRVIVYVMFVLQLLLNMSWIRPLYCSHCFKWSYFQCHFTMALQWMMVDQVLYCTGQRGLLCIQDVLVSWQYNWQNYIWLTRGGRFLIVLRWIGPAQSIAKSICPFWDMFHGIFLYDYMHWGSLRISRLFLYVCSSLLKPSCL